MKHASSPIAILTALFLTAPLSAQVTARVALDPGGADGDQPSGQPSLSGDGRFVAFASRATNLVPGDTNGVYDVFVRDRRTGTTTRVSVDSQGNQTAQGGGSTNPAISADGRFVVFESGAPDLVPGDTNGKRDVFVHDRETGATTRVSLGSSGGESNGFSENASISGDGRFVAFTSNATNLHPLDADTSRDVYVHDRVTGLSVLASVSSNGDKAFGNSTGPSISADGSLVAFTAQGSNLVSDDTNGATDVFVHDLTTGTTIRVSVDSSGDQGDGPSGPTRISGDGTTVAFASYATNLVAGDQNGVGDIFVHELGSGCTERVSLTRRQQEGDDHSQFVAISANGRSVAFQSQAANLVPGDSNGTEDIFVHDRLRQRTHRVSISSTGAESNNRSYGPEISADGRHVTFDSYASNLVPGDTNGEVEPFVHGAELILEATPSVVTEGSTLEFTTWAGAHGDPAYLYAIRVNGQPTFFRIAVGAFDANGEWSTSFLVPDLAGLEVVFVVFAFAPRGRVERTNEETVSFQ